MDDVTPIRDESLTRCEKKDASIANLWRAVTASAQQTLELVAELESLQERVKHLESMLPTIHPKRQTAPLQSEQLAAIHNLRTEVTP